MSVTNQKSHGFTIVELLIVIVIIGILATIVIVAYNGITTKANLTAAISNATQSGQKIAIYYTENGTLPADLASAGITNTTDLQYTANTSGNSFCLTATKSTQAASVGGIAGSVNPTTPGPCPGHTADPSSIPGTNNSNKLSNGKTCPTGYIVVPGSSVYGTSDFCVMKYEAKIQGNDNGQTTYTTSLMPDSRATGTPWANISQTQAIAAAQKPGAGYHLMTEAEWMTLAANVLSVPSNWSGGAVGSGYIYSGHNDNAPANALAADPSDANGYAGETNTGGNQRRTLTLTNGQVVWDMAGNVWEWTNATISGNQPGASGYTYRSYTSITDFKGLPNSSRPSSLVIPGQNPASWSSAQGIGQLYSNSDEMAVQAFRRGSGFQNTGNAGLLALDLSYTLSKTDVTIGFRAASPGN